MRRFFIPPSAVSEEKIFISGAEAHHLHTVLRLKHGEIITLFDGTGISYKAQIEDLSKEVIRCTILSTDKIERSGPTLHLGQALLTGSKMDLICQKTTELGISTIQPFVSERCTVTKKSDKRISRWQRIVLEACKQSGQPITPEILAPLELSELFEERKQFDSKLIFYEEGQQTQDLNDLFNEGEHLLPASLFFLIGPEGGFTQEEVTQALEAGYTPVSLGKLILRAETASLTATAILQFLLGNLRYNKQDII